MSDAAVFSELRIKAVPGASRDAVAGMLGDRLKVRVSAPPEGGKANKAIVALLAGEIGVRKTDIELVSGHTNPEKTLRIRGVSGAQLASLLGVPSST